MDLSDLKPYEEAFNRFKNQLNEQVSLAIEVLRTLIDRRSDVSSCSSKSSRIAQIKGPSTTHSTPNNLSGYASRSLQDERLQKMEKAASLKTQLSFHAEQSKLRERRAALEEEEQRLKMQCEIAALEASIEATKATDGIEQGCPTRGPREGSEWPARVFRNDQYYQLNCYVIYGELTFREICIYCLLSFKLILLYHNAHCFTSHFPYCYVHILSTQSCSCFKSQSVSQ